MLSLILAVILPCQEPKLDRALFYLNSPAAIEAKAIKKSNVKESSSENITIQKEATVTYDRRYRGGSRSSFC